MTKEEVESAIKSAKRNKIFLKVSYTTSLIEINKQNFRFLETSMSCLWTNYKYSDIIEVFTDLQQIRGDVTFGSDPELFFTKSKKVVPSVALLPEKDTPIGQDGFQLELHPRADTCRETSGNRVSRLLMEADALAKSKGMSISLKVGHVIDDVTWAKTPKEVRQFGCSETSSTHEPNRRRITGQREKFRACGGHIHIGTYILVGDEAKQRKFVDIADAICGSLFVLLDTDKNNIRRRKHYGRAGEYRAKSYGVEYRVLSNFWLYDYRLWSLATAQLRNAVNIIRAGLDYKLFEYIDMKTVRKAINNNDQELAMEVYLNYVKFIKENKVYSASGLSVMNIDKVTDWLENKPRQHFNISVKGALESWYRKRFVSNFGFEKFIDNYKPVNK